MWRKREIQKIMTKNEALQKALDALGPTPPDCCGCQEEWQIAIDAIKEALANDTSQERVDKTSESVHEPVGLIESLKDAQPCCGEYQTCWRACTPCGKFLAQRTWVGLTDEDTFEIGERLGLSDIAWVDLMQAIETKLRSKND